MLVHTQSVRVRTFDVDAYDGLSICALAGYLQEAAAEHAAQLGCGMGHLRESGLTWVLASERLGVHEPIRHGDVVDIETWPSGVDRLAFAREFRVRRQGGVVAVATTRWLVLDLTTRRPVMPNMALDPRLFEAADRVLSASAGKFPALERGREQRFPVRYADIDVNEHANNTAYVSWVLEGVPESIWRTCRVTSLELQFLAECRYGGAVISRAAEAGEREFWHAVASAEDGRDLARARTSWMPRDVRPALDRE
ncbi:MAG: acyl-ACP thioesterase [Polyangiaceae bacterium]|nr:acyl-ACP thioesterase [Polyangiaceae bacterium]